MSKIVFFEDWDIPTKLKTRGDLLLFDLPEQNVVCFLKAYGLLNIHHDGKPAWLLAASIARFVEWSSWGLAIGSC